MLKWDGRDWPMYLEPPGWRLRCRAKGREADHRTGTTRLDLAKRRAKEWLERRAADPRVTRRGGGTLEGLVTAYLAMPRRAGERAAKVNVARLRTVCRVALGKELADVTCREVGPSLWEAYQRKALESAGYRFDLSTRRRENVGINSALRAARSVVLRSLVPAYRAGGLDVLDFASEVRWLPEPYLPPSVEDGAAIVRAWRSLPVGSSMWVAIGLARFAGMRRDEIGAARGFWVRPDPETGGAAVVLMDRPEDGWWTKTGRPAVGQVAEPAFAEWLAWQSSRPDLLVDESSNWMRYAPQKWLKGLGVTARKPLHRLRGLYADQIRQLTEDAVAAQIAGLRAAQQALGHTSDQTTRDHYLTPDALR